MVPNEVDGTELETSETGETLPSHAAVAKGLVLGEAVSLFSDFKEISSACVDVGWGSG